MLHLPDDWDAADAAFLASFTHPAGTQIPDGAIVEGMVVVLSYLDPADGAQRWFAHARYDVPVSQVVGLLDMAKIDMILRTCGTTAVGDADG